MRPELRLFSFVDLRDRKRQKANNVHSSEAGMDNWGFIDEEETLRIFYDQRSLEYDVTVSQMAQELQREAEAGTSRSVLNAFVVPLPGLSRRSHSKQQRPCSRRSMQSKSASTIPVHATGTVRKPQPKSRPRDKVIRLPPNIAGMPHNTTEAPWSADMLTMGTKELNAALRQVELTPEQITRLKKYRRLIKGRGYSKTHRRRQRGLPQTLEFASSAQRARGHMAFKDMTDGRSVDAHTEDYSERPSEEEDDDDDDNKDNQDNLSEA
jgi:hypothetical protein